MREMEDKLFKYVLELENDETGTLFHSSRTKITNETIFAYLVIHEYYQVFLKRNQDKKDKDEKKFKE